MPSSECSPPTARPGRSLHERGLAVDFNCRGELVDSRADPCFRWLDANAARFGLYNLPSEPWHWSVTGQ
jgi:LAS superfamily LD-carboxypeptidase LdcB